MQEREKNPAKTGFLADRGPIPGRARPRFLDLPVRSNTLGAVVNPGSSTIPRPTARAIENSRDTNTRDRLWLFFCAVG